MNNHKKLCLLLVVSLFVTTMVAAPLVSACTYKEGKKPKVDIKFKGWKKTSEGYKFTYEVQSGSGSSKIKYWKMYSTVFNKYDVVDASESFDQDNGYIKFSESYDSGEKRTVWFVVEKGYKPIKLGQVKVVIKTLSNCKYFRVQGPRLVWK